MDGVVPVNKGLDFNPKKARQDFFERHFLNGEEFDHSGSSRLDLTVRRKGTKKKGYHWTLMGNMEIRDCARRVDLTFEGNTKSDIKNLHNSRYKLERLKMIAEKGLAVLDAMQEAHDNQ